MDPTDAELDAATDAYVKARWRDVKDWRNAYPQQWRETRDRIRLALVAAATVRGADPSSRPLSVGLMHARRASPGQAVCAGQTPEDDDLK